MPPPRGPELESMVRSLLRTNGVLVKRKAPLVAPVMLTERHDTVRVGGSETERLCQAEEAVTGAKVMGLLDVPTACSRPVTVKL